MRSSQPSLAELGELVRVNNQRANKIKFLGLQSLCISQWPKACWVMPTAFCLNSLFVPCYRQPRLIQSIDLVHLWKSRKGIYRGPRLDLADADLFMALLTMHHQKGVPLGAVFCVPTYAILSACKPLRKTFGSSDYLWSSKALKRLYDARMILSREKAPDVVERIGSESLPLRLVKEFSISSSSITLQFDPRLATLFENSQFTLIDIECHVKLRSDLSKALHLVFASMRERVQRHRLSRLLLRLDYIIPTGKAKKKIDEACQNLETATVLETHDWEVMPDEIVLVIKRPNSGYARHL